MLVCRHDELSRSAALRSRRECAGDCASCSRVQMLKGLIEPCEGEACGSGEHEEVCYEPSPDTFTTTQRVPRQLLLSNDADDRPIRLQLQALFSKERLPPPPDLLGERFDVLSGELLGR